MNNTELIHNISLHAMNIRIKIIKMLVTAGSGHSAGPLGMAEIFATLFYGKLLKYNLENPYDKDRDIFILSNGHICPVYYATLHEIGWFDTVFWNRFIKKQYPLKNYQNYQGDNILETLREFGSPLQGHPERILLPGLENTSGPLGSGLSQGIGMGLGLKIKNQQNLVVVVMGDGEHDEGNVWESILLASKYRLNNLIVIVDRNQIQIDGPTEQVLPLGNLAEKYREFGWYSQDVDGNSIAEFLEAFEIAKHQNLPAVIIANTIPGKGVDFMESDFNWHGKPPNSNQAIKALEEINAEIQELELNN